MKVGQLIAGISMDGVAVYVADLTKALVAHGHSVVLVHPEGSWSAAQVRSLGIEMIPSDLRRDRREVFRINDELKQRGVDVIHTHYSRANTFGMFLKILGMPRVATAHSLHFQPHWLFNDRVIAPSDEASRYMHRVNLVPKRKLVVIPNTVDLPAFPQVTEASRKKARELMGFGEDLTIIGSVGAVIERKRPQDLVAAFLGIRSRVGGAKLVIAGHPNDEVKDQIDAMVKAAGAEADVHLLGSRYDVPILMPGFDVFALASARETGPLSVVEAMAVGLPVVSTNVGAVPAYVAEGKSGYVTPKGDIPSMSARLLALAEAPELRRRLGMEGRRRAETLFSTEATFARVEAVLEDAARTRRGTLSQRQGSAGL